MSDIIPNAIGKSKIIVLDENQDEIMTLQVHLVS